MSKHLQHKTLLGQVSLMEIPPQSIFSGGNNPSVNLRRMLNLFQIFDRKDPIAREGHILVGMLLLLFLLLRSTMRLIYLLQSHDLAFNRRLSQSTNYLDIFLRRFCLPPCALSHPGPCYSISLSASRNCSRIAPRIHHLVTLSTPSKQPFEIQAPVHLIRSPVSRNRGQ
jgi:hypothetical protein